MPTIEQASPPPTPPIDVLSHPTREDRRVDLETQIALEYPGLEAPVTTCTQNLSATGMFIKTAMPRPPSTVFKFELDLGHGLGSITGRAEVVWVRRQGDGLFRPAGAGVSFLDLDPEGRQLIRWSVERRTQELRQRLGTALRGGPGAAAPHP